MTLTRRGFVGGVLAAAFVPAVAKTITPEETLASLNSILMFSNTMAEIKGTVQYSDGTNVVVSVDPGGMDGDFTVEGWYTEGQWHEYKVWRTDGVLKHSINGVEGAMLPNSHLGWSEGRGVALFGDDDKEVLRFPVTKVEIGNGDSVRTSVRSNDQWYEVDTWRHTTSPGGDPNNSRPPVFPVLRSTNSDIAGTP